MKTMIFGLFVLTLSAGACRENNQTKKMESLQDDDPSDRPGSVLQGDGEAASKVFFLQIDTVDLQDNSISNVLAKEFTKLPLLVEMEFAAGTQLTIQATSQDPQGRELATKYCPDEQQTLHIVKPEPVSQTFKVHLCHAATSAEDKQSPETVEVTIQVQSGSPQPMPQPRPTPQPTPSPQPQPTPQVPSACHKSDTLSCETEARIVQLMNQKRESAGLAPLTLSREGSFVAREWSKSQAAAGRISHDGFPGGRQAVLIQEFPGSSIRFSGENVAYFSAMRPETASEIANTLFNMWWNSSGHRRNMLGQYRYIGVGLHVEKNSTGMLLHYGTQLFQN